MNKERAELLRRIMNFHSPSDFLSIQETVAECICELEQSKPKQTDGDKNSHQIRKFRRLVDGLAWDVLHPHTIRQLAKNNNAGPPPSISSQGAAFKLVVEAAKRNVSRHNVSVLVCDLTNILRIGDLVVCMDREHPLIIECKNNLPKPEYLMQGRRGRQIRRALGTARYLETGQAKVFGEDSDRLALDSTHMACRNWAVINELCSECQETGLARRDLSPNETIWAFQPSVAGKTPSFAIDGKAGETGYFGTTTGLMNMDDGLFAPPVIWPIDLEHRQAILEGDIVIAHFVHARAFSRDAPGDPAIEMHQGNERSIHVRLDGKTYPLSHRFVYDVLYGFETVESCVSGIVDFAKQIAALNTSTLRIPKGERPCIRHVDS